MAIERSSKRLVVCIPDTFFAALEEMADQSLMSPVEYTRFLLRRAVLQRYRRIDQGAAVRKTNKARAAHPDQAAA